MVAKAAMLLTMTGFLPPRALIRGVAVLLIALGIFQHAPAARAADVFAELRALRTAPSVDELRGRLLALGFSVSAINRAAAFHDPQGEVVFSADTLKRAESWDVNLDPDREPELVIQVSWQYENQNMEFNTFYLILVLDAKEQGGKVLGEYVFDLTGCDYARDKPLTLTFAAIPGKPYKEIRFNVGEATSCGTYVEIMSHREVLSWSEKLGRLEFVKGKPKKGGVDRLDFARP